MKWSSEMVDRAPQRRLFIADGLARIHDELFEPSPSEQHYLDRVLRLQPGDLIELFDGQGGCCRATIRRTGSKNWQLHCLTWNLQPAPPLRIVVAASPPKNERMLFLVEKLTELGASQLHWLQCTRTPPMTGARRVLERCQKRIIDATRQSHRYHMLDMASEQLDLNAWCASLPPTRDQHWRWFGDVPAQDASISHTDSSLRDRLATRPITISIAVGPEGDWTEPERQTLLRHGFLAVQISPHILRLETAALALVSVAQHLSTLATAERATS